MAQIIVTLPDQLMEKARLLAEREGVNLSEFFIWIIAEQVGRLSRKDELTNVKPSYQKLARITNISQDGINVLIQNEADDYRNIFVPFSSYPQFITGSLEQIFDVESFLPGVLSWPRLYLDISIEQLTLPSDRLSGKEKPHASL